MGRFFLSVIKELREEFNFHFPQLYQCSDRNMTCMYKHRHGRVFTEERTQQHT